VDGEMLVPVAFRGEFTAEIAAVPLELLRARVGEGITGRCAATGESMLIGDAANCEFGSRIPGTPSIEESLLAVPLRYGARVVGVIVVSQLGLTQFDEDDVRLLEVLAGHAAVAVENASLYESARREAESATQLLEFGRELASASSLEDILERIVESTSTLIDSPRTSVWIEDEDGWLTPRKLHGHTEEERTTVRERQLHVSSARKGRGAGPEPFVVSPEQYASSDSEPLHPEASYAVAPFGV